MSGLINLCLLLILPGVKMLWTGTYWTRKYWIELDNSVFMGWSTVRCRLMSPLLIISLLCSPVELELASDSFDSLCFFFVVCSVLVYCVQTSFVFRKWMCCVQPSMKFVRDLCLNLSASFKFVSKPICWSPVHECCILANLFLIWSQTPAQSRISGY